MISILKYLQHLHIWCGKQMQFKQIEYSIQAETVALSAFRSFSARSNNFPKNMDPFLYSQMSSLFAK